MFGTTGYTMNNVFLLYDRRTESIWYPIKNGAFDAVSGEQKGAKIPFVAKPARIPLGKWRGKHPDTLVMLPPPYSKSVQDLPTPKE